MSENQAKIIYVTCSSHDEALKIAKTLLEEKQIACANIFPHATSLYRWNGILEETLEVVMILKTSVSSKKLPLLTARIIELHPYECPSILILPIENGNSAFLKWLETSVNIT